MDKFIIFLSGVSAMVVLIKYRKKVIDFTGKIDWIEQKLGQGGSYSAVIILGIVIWLLSLMYSLGTLDTLFGFLKPLS